MVSTTKTVPGDTQRSHLPDLFAVVDFAGGKGNVKYERFPLKIGNGNQHGKPHGFGEVYLKGKYGSSAGQIAELLTFSPAEYSAHPTDLSNTHSK